MASRRSTGSTSKCLQLLSKLTHILFNTPVGSEGAVATKGSQQLPVELGGWHFALFGFWPEGCTHMASVAPLAATFDQDLQDHHSFTFSIQTLLARSVFLFPQRVLLRFSTHSKSNHLDIHPNFGMKHCLSGEDFTSAHARIPMDQLDQIRFPLSSIPSEEIVSQRSTATRLY
jgi:hypothetical protein